MAKTFFLPIAFVLLIAGFAAAQTVTPTQPPKRVTVPRSPSVIPGEQENSHIPEEMRIKMEIARADEEYKKTLEDADKLSMLSGEVTRAFQGAGKLAGDDLKKLGSIEKLAKRILSQAGGDEVGDRSEDLQSKPLNDALDQLSAAADRVQKCIKEQTRFVVSATVISNANDIIHLSQHIRRIAKAN